MDTQLEQEADFSAKPPPRQTVSPPLRILVVDDERDGAETLATLLRLSGYSVCVAFDGLQALREADSFSPDVILLDIGLPKMDGFEVVRRLRARGTHNHPFVIAVTGHGQEEHVRRSQEAGIDMHLLKPVRFAELGDLLTRLEGIVPPLP